MEIKQQTNLTFISADIINVTYTSHQPYLPNAPVNLTITPKVFYPKDFPNDFSIVIELSINSPEYYDIHVTAIGRFLIDTQLPDNLRKPFINSNGPAILFPYVRAFISTLTSNLGTSVNHVIIPPHFFIGDLEEIREEDFNS